VPDRPLPVATALAVAGFLLARQPLAFVLVACLYAGCRTGLAAVRQALLAGWWSRRGAPRGGPNSGRWSTPGSASGPRSVAWRSGHTPPGRTGRLVSDRQRGRVGWLTFGVLHATAAAGWQAAARGR
jgi:hypothetical protein